MSNRDRLLLLALLAVNVASPATAQAEGWIEPNAGHWRTWVIASGEAFRVPPPPSQSETRAELGALAALLSHNDAKTLQQIDYWDAGAPAYRWIELINARSSPMCRPRRTRPASTPMWRWRCTTRRSRRGSRSISTTGSVRASSITSCRRQLPVPTVRRIRPSMRQPRRPPRRCSPTSCPAEGRDVPGHGRAGGVVARARRSAVSERLPSRARPRAARWRSKYRQGAGRWLDAVWTGTVPTGPCKWIGANPGNVDAPRTGRRCCSRRPAIPAPGAARLRLAAGRSPKRRRSRTSRASERDIRDQLQGVLLAKPGRPGSGPYRYADKWMFEDRLDQNPPRAARVYALIAAGTSTRSSRARTASSPTGTSGRIS